MRCPPVHGLRQNLQTMPLPVQPSKQAMQTAVRKLILPSTLTWMQLFVCCLGDRKKVPSISGYLSKMVMMFLHKTQGTLFILLLA